MIDVIIKDLPQRIVKLYENINVEDYSGDTLGDKIDAFIATVIDNQIEPTNTWLLTNNEIKIFENT